MITEALIKYTFNEEMKRAVKLIPASEWKVRFTGFKLNNRKTAYGTANSRGVISISRVFVGTEAVDDLIDTVRHEIAHLIAGMAAKHGPSWKRAARKIGASQKASSKAGTDCLKENMARPLELYAILEDGSRVLVGKRHKRNRKYANYKATRTRACKTSGKVIAYFEYVRAS